MRLLESAKLEIHSLHISSPCAQIDGGLRYGSSVSLDSHIAHIDISYPWASTSGEW